LPLPPHNAAHIGKCKNVQQKSFQDKWIRQFMISWQCSRYIIYEWKEASFSFGENPIPKASEPGLKYNTNDIKTTENAVKDWKEIWVFTGKIRELTPESGTVLGGRCLRKDFEKNWKKKDTEQIKWLCIEINDRQSPAFSQGQQRYIFTLKLWQIQL
jgi:hypothetical protein